MHVEKQFEQLGTVARTPNHVQREVSALTTVLASAASLASQKTWPLMGKILDKVTYSGISATQIVNKIGEENKDTTKTIEPAGPLGTTIMVAEKGQ